MTEINTTNHYYTKDFDAYKQTEDNFVANQELTVTITLNEYRNLITEKAGFEQKIDKTRNQYYEKCNKVDELEEEIKSLKEKIYNLQNPCEYRTISEEEHLNE
ncbi:hypothetical protein RCO12_10890 [Staphylococcus coagulans]|uniref:Phage protein n=1 Tax=Staphylococcus coagulans TaxID=74706 RepID=A0ABU1F1S8_9STAP|nr:hypothetical protein [Staphylococcus coagulans]MDR5603939.1 hypothetical protein [Staphylococcus coagulans]MDR9833867.1 hypothetical protein [Staphylococcus coagulans]